MRDHTPDNADIPLFSGNDGQMPADFAQADLPVPLLNMLPRSLRQYAFKKSIGLVVCELLRNDLRGNLSFKIQYTRSCPCLPTRDFEKLCRCLQRRRSLRLSIECVV